jgi:putative flippase GtrA
MRSLLPGRPGTERPEPGLLRRAVRYGLAGLFATAVYFGAVALLVETAGVRPVGAAALATVLVIVISYVVNRGWVFDTDRSHASAFSRFVAASVLSIALNTGLMHLSVNVLGWPYVAGLALATLVVPPTNFAINYLWCFRAAPPPRA